jgi:hypothetical protein
VLDNERAIELETRSHSMKSSGLTYRVRILALLLFGLTGFTSVAAAQDSVQIDIGIRGGFLPHSSFQAKQSTQVPQLVDFTTYSFIGDKPDGTVGITASALLNTRVEFRFEAVRRHFDYRVQAQNLNPPELGELLESVHGHLWEYPLLVTYRFRSGSLQPFAGGGASIATNGSYTTDSLRTQRPRFEPVRTIASHTVSGVPSSTSYYFVAGIDGRTPHFSIRPEFRIILVPGGSLSDNRTELRKYQPELVIGVSFPVFRKKYKN